MKGFWSYFWILYLLFFAIPFPMLIYYNTKEGPANTYPWLALAYLLVSVVLWAITLQGWFRKWVLLPYKIKRDMEHILKTGARKEARIVESSERGPVVNGLVPMDITFTMRNFSGTEIRNKMEVNDSRPAEHRYDVGKTIYLLIDEKLKAEPPMVLEGVQVSIKPARIALLVFLWLVVAAAVVWYYLFSYQLESNGGGWRFMTFYHPLLLCPLILGGTRWGFSLLLRAFAASPEDQLELKLYGLKTDAQLINVKETGTYINEQPQVRFELRYQDNTGKTHNVSLKKIVPLIDLAGIKKETVSIFYLKDKPEQIAFTSDLES